MTQLAAVPSVPDTEDEQRTPVDVRRSGADRAYRLVLRCSGALTLLLMAFIGGFLLIRARPALHQAGWSFLTERQWVPSGGRFGILALLVGTVMIALVALVIAVPLSLGAALFITDYAPPWLRRLLTSLVDLLAAVPSLVYGLWGRFFLQPRLIGVSRWLGTHLAFVPVFKTSRPDYAASTFIAGVVVSLMILPICTAVMREVFSGAPPGEKEGALALGATRWGMIRMVVLPFGKGGIIGGSMLGLGRALGETIAVTLIISPIFTPTVHILEGGGNSIAAHIALRFGEADDFGLSALMAAGLALFTVTLVVNALASIVVSRSRSGAATEL
ncbi:MAG TPA: phosphate ABC transporter permease subunit PstC [Acidimicrobiales bacterium]|nr:phosphate ABC transporter permease subunit PstC [Acidimicrobiales bacterium]